MDGGSDYAERVSRVAQPPKVDSSSEVENQAFAHSSKQAVKSNFSRSKAHAQSGSQVRQHLIDEEKTAEKQNIEEQLDKAAVAEAKIKQSDK